MNATNAAETATKELLDRAHALHQAGHLDAAQLLYREVLVLEPRNIHALHSLGLAAHARGERHEALSLLSQVVALKSDEAVFHHSLAQALRANGRLNDALDSLKRAVSVNPNFVGGWQVLAEVYFALNRRGDAVKAMGKMAELKQLAERYNQNGLDLRKKGRQKEARDAFRAAIDCNPNGAGFYYNLGCVLVDLGELTDALLCLGQAGTLAPKSPEPFVALSNALFRKGDLQGASKAREHAQALDSKIPSSRFLLDTGSLSNPFQRYVLGSVTASVTFETVSNTTPGASTLPKS